MTAPRPAERLGRACVAMLAILLAVGWTISAGTSPAWAATADSYDSWNTSYVVNTDGSVNVTETFTLRFGTSSGRHGADRFLITREQWNDTQDAVYPVTNIGVSSPSNVSTAFALTTTTTGRTDVLRIRIGDANRTITTPTATYVLTYTLAGALRTSGSYDEFFWDVTGADMPPITTASVTVAVPGGAQDVFCSSASVGVNKACTSATIGADGKAVFTQSGIPTGELLTVSVKIKAGLVSDNAPHLVESRDQANQRIMIGLGILAGVLTIGFPILGWLYWRRRSADLRFAGLPPGVLPAAGQSAPEVPDRPAAQVPVAFVPPKVALAEAGMLLDGSTQIRHTTATMVGLAVAGAIQLTNEPYAAARLIDPRRVPDAESDQLLRDLGLEGNQWTSLAKAGGLTRAHRNLRRLVEGVAASNRWFLRRGSSARLGLGGLVPLIIFAIYALQAVPAGFLFVIPVLVSAFVTIATVARRLARGQRTGLGRALTDQVEGFRLYLATAEANQLKFEEGEDIFSKYLPWAVLFDLTERWTRLCEQLIAEGRLPDVMPYWWYGNVWNMHLFAGQLNTMTNTMVQAFTPSPEMVRGTGFGGGSAFGGGGGGFSGGGGGGGGGGSW